MKTKLLKKVRKKYKVFYREDPYIITNGFTCLNYVLIAPNSTNQYCLNKNKALERLIDVLRWDYPNLGNYNRQRKIKETEYKVWYNE